MQTLPRFRQQLDALPHFVVLAAPTAPPESGLKAQVRDILESPPDRIYRDGIESIDRAEIVDGAIEGEFSDRVGVRAVKRVGFRITPEEIETWILNPDEVAKFSVYQGEVLALFAPMFGKGSRAKAKNCTKGLSCGNGCIARGKKCSKTPSPQTKKKIEGAIGGGGGDAQPDDAFAKAGAQNFEAVKGEAIAKIFEEPDDFDGIFRNFEVEVKAGGKKKVSWIVTNKKKLAFAAEAERDQSKDFEANPAALELVKEKWNRKICSISFSVDNSIFGKISDRDEAMTVARSIRKQWPKILSKIPVGTIVTNTPVDGAHGRRARIYSRMGFGQQDDLTLNQCGIVVKQGRTKTIVPLQFGRPVGKVESAIDDDLNLNIPSATQALIERMRRAFDDDD